MKGFIEVRVYEGTIRHLIPIKEIKRIKEHKPVSIITEDDIFFPNESYEEIKELIKNAQ